MNHLVILVQSPRNALIIKTIISCVTTLYPTAMA